MGITLSECSLYDNDQLPEHSRNGSRGSSSAPFPPGGGATEEAYANSEDAPTAIAQTLYPSTPNAKVINALEVFRFHRGAFVTNVIDVFEDVGKLIRT